MRDKPERLEVLLVAVAALLIVLAMAEIVNAEPRGIHKGILAGDLQPAERGTQVQVNPPPPETYKPEVYIPDPVDFDCESWRPLLEKYDMPFGLFKPIMFRESRCTNARNYSTRTRDDSYGVLQTNRWGSMAAVYDRNDIDRSFHATPEGGVAAAALLYHSCGTLGPWTKPYSCPGGWPG